MIDALVAGKLVGAVVERAASSGKTFVSGKVRVADSVAVSGTMKVGTYEARDGTTRISINVVVSAVLSAYGVKRKREAVAHASNSKTGETRAPSAGKRNGLREARALRGNSTIGTIQDDDVDF